MKNNFKNIVILLCFLVSFAIISSCKQENPSNKEEKTSNEEIKIIDKDTITTNIEEDNKQLDANLVFKDRLIKEKIIEKGYNYSVFRVSSLRNQKENDLLPLSAKNSFHLLGKALDVIVLDINKDYRVNLKDVDLFVSIIKEVEAENKALVGGIGTYKNKWYSKQMVHFDTRGYAAYWNY